MQTATAITPREPDKRNVTADSRTLYAAAREDALDVVDSFSNILKYCAKFSPEHLVDVSNPTSIKIVKLNGFPSDVEYSLLIKDDFHVETYRRHMKVLIRDQMNWFSSTVTKYSQIDTIVDRLKSTPLNVPCELRSFGGKVLNLADEIESTDLQRRRKITFTGKQLLSLECNRYSKDDMTDAINLYLRSRNSYRALREILVLPSRNTGVVITSGNMAWLGAPWNLNEQPKISFHL